MSSVTKRQVVAHTAVAGTIAALALLLLLVSAATKTHWIPEYAECARLGSVALILSASVWTSIGWLSFLLNR